MGKLPNDPLRELIAQGRAKGLTWADALREAGVERPVRQASIYSRDPIVLARVEELLAETADKTKMDLTRLFALYVTQATYDPLEFVDITSHHDLEKVPEELRRAVIKGWKYDKQGRLMLDLVDKSTAMTALARHLSFFNDTLKVDVTDFEAELRRAEIAAGVVVDAAAERLAHDA